MKHLLRFACLAALCAPLAFGQATGNTTIQPDCLIPFTLSAAGNSPATSVANAANDNRTKGCAAWTLMYQSTGLAMVTVTLQSGCSTSTTVSYGTFAGDIPTSPMSNANPIVSDTGGELTAVNGTACISWVRVNVAATGTGTLTGVLYGFRNSSSAVNSGGGGSGGTCPQGPSGSVQYSDGTDCQGSASFIWDNADSLAKVGGSPITPFAGLYVGPDESTLPAFMQGYTTANTVLLVSSGNPTTAVNFGIESVGDISLYMVATGDIPTAIEMDLFGGKNGGGIVALNINTNANGFSQANVTGIHISQATLGSGGTIVDGYGILIEDQINATSNWAIKSGAGMVEIGDATKAAGIHVQGAGAFTSSSLLWLDPDVGVALPFIISKTTASAAAPGAAECDLRWIAGTIGSSGKIVAVCGTSATEVTIADNVGTGF